MSFVYAHGSAGVVHAAMGQFQSQNSEHLRLAQMCFQAVGSSPAECDTIPGGLAWHCCLIDGAKPCC